MFEKYLCEKISFQEIILGKITSISLLFSKIMRKLLKKFKSLFTNAFRNVY